MREKFVKYGFTCGFPNEYLAGAMRGEEDKKEFILEKIAIYNRRNSLKEQLLKEFENSNITVLSIQDHENGNRTLLTKSMIENWNTAEGSLKTWQTVTCRGRNYRLKMSHIENIINVIRDKNYPTGAEILTTPDYTIDSNCDITGAEYWYEK